MGKKSLFLAVPPKMRYSPPMKEEQKATARLSQRHEPQIIDDLKTIANESGISQVALVSACVTALKKTWQEDHELTFPFRVIPEKTYLSLTRHFRDHQLKVVATDPTPYGTD